MYRIGLRLVSPWNRKAKLWLEGRKALFEKISAEMRPVTGASPATKADSRAQPAGEALPVKMAAAGEEKTGRVIWIHCSSLGEFEQGRPVIERLREEAPGCRIVLTFFSPSGYTAKKNYTGVDHVFYLPLDSPRNARRFIDLIRPDLVLWVKYDYWYYFLVELRRRNIPLLLISGIFRPDQPFFHWYGRLHRFMLECFTHLFVQTEASRALLQQLRLTEQVSVSGDTRFDRVIEIAEKAERLPLIESFCGTRPVIVAGSTWEEDEEELDHYANTHPDIRFIIAPHEISEERLREVERLFRHSIRYSVWQGGPSAKAGSTGMDAGRAAGKGGSGRTETGGWPEPNVLIIDNIGMLSRLYGYATITYVGGGFGDDGVHNVLEAAVYGKPVVLGPVIEKYIEAVELTDCGGGLIIDSAIEAEKVFTRLLQYPQECAETGAAARDYVYSRRGATERIIRYIRENRLLTR
ncbi:MAG TPA: glycosyltransferase N-terminal domain-containing protein [Puia sp.]|nr:glycosyltransferase N-terminal domain-containing protein [Puia sp.]